MIERMAVFFPPEFTAIAEWIVCTLHILCSRKRLRGWKAVLLILFALPVLLALNYAHVDQPAPLWLVMMICCLLVMLCYLRLGLKYDFSLVVQTWCHAVMQAEFAAALAYLVVVFLVSLHVLRFSETPVGGPADVWIYRMVMAAVYAVVFIPLGILIRQRAQRRDQPMKIGGREVFSNLAIAVGAFVLSNVSFLAPESIFGTGMGAGILFVRTVSDFSGMMALYAMDEFSHAMQLKMTVSVLQNMVDNQYAQYQQFKVNNDQMQQVYHDIKHLIHYIRSVSSSNKYEKELRNMEDVVSNYEAQYDTGNTVLDVVLSNKKMLCRSEQITMECYVDAQEMGFLDTAHICSIFGNALDNAIEYESKIGEIEKRLIKVSVFSENHFLVIHISNYCETPVLIAQEELETTKQNPEMHGFGIKGIRLAVEQYDGHMNIKQENNWFILSILIPIPVKNTDRLV